MKKSVCSHRSALLWGLAALFAAGPALAAYEVTSYSPDIPTNTATQLTTDLNVVLDKPDTGTDTFTGFVYLWSRSATVLSDTDLNEDKASTFGDLGGFFTASALSENNQVQVPLGATNFANDDYADLWYLHVKTQYLSSLIEYYSADTVIGPFNIDNVVDGSIAVVDDNGQTLTETRETRLNVKVAGPGDLVNFYLAETPTKPTAPTTVPDTNTVTYDLTDTTTGTRTLYAWFEDQAGNLSPSPATATFTLLPSVSITPNTVTIDLATTTTQVFSIDGSSAGYDWSIKSQNPDNTGDTVCQLPDTGTTNTTTVTLTAVNPGTCVLQAALSGSTSQVLESGTITVTKSVTFSLDIDGNGTIDSGTDGILIVRYLLDFPSFYGDNWIDGVVGDGATRTSATDISSYIKSAVDAKTIDIDGNGTIDSGTDGILIVRYMLDFPSFYGDSWINGVVGDGATKTSASAIQSAIENLK